MIHYHQQTFTKQMRKVHKGFHETKTCSFISEKKVFPHKIINQDLN